MAAGFGEKACSVGGTPGLQNIVVASPDASKYVGNSPSTPLVLSVSVLGDQ